MYRNIKPRYETRENTSKLQKGDQFRCKDCSCSFIILQILKDPQTEDDYIIICNNTCNKHSHLKMFWPFLSSPTELEFTILKENCGIIVLPRQNMPKWIDYNFKPDKFVATAFIESLNAQ